MQAGRGLDVLAVGSDTSLLQRLMHYAGRLSPRLVEHRAANPLTAGLSKASNGTALINGKNMLPIS